jgi:ribosomal protein S18 acetylase RimI-like enzyme
VSAVATVATPAFVLRAGKPEDRAYVARSWTQADMWRPESRLLGRAVHARGHSRLVDHILSKPDTRVLVAADPGDTDAILGWSCTGPGVVYYVSVRRELRRVGIGRALLSLLPPGAPVVYTHRPTIHGLRPPKDWTYDPYRNWL